MSAANEFLEDLAAVSIWEDFRLVNSLAFAGNFQWSDCISGLTE